MPFNPTAEEPKTPSPPLPKPPEEDLSTPSAEVDVTILPSQFRAYPENVTVKFRPYTFGEIENLNEDHMKPRDRFEFMLKGINVMGMKRDDLTVSDFFFVALLRKLSTLQASSFKVEWSCGECSHKNSIQTSIKKLKFADMAAPKLPVNIDSFAGLGKVSFRPLSIGDYLELMKLNKKDVVVSRVQLLAKMITNHHYKQAYEALFDCSGNDQINLREVDRLLFHSLEPLKVVCDNMVPDKDSEVEDDKGNPPEKQCGKAAEIDLDGWEAIIIPFRSEGKSPTSGISFGDEGNS